MKHQSQAEDTQLEHKKFNLILGVLFEILLHQENVGYKQQFLIMQFRSLLDKKHFNLRKITFYIKDVMFSSKEKSTHFLSTLLKRYSI